MHTIKTAYIQECFSCSHQKSSPDDRFEPHDHLESTDSKCAYLKFVKAGYDRKILMYGYDKSISNNKGRAIDIIHTVSGADLY